MNEQIIYNQLHEQRPSGYRINELIFFSYPVRRLRLTVLVNKQPDDALSKVYNILLRTIQMGLQDQKQIFDFLGISPNDDFMIREFYQLRAMNYIDFVSDKWFVTPTGEAFIKDNSVFRVEEEEEFEFLIDAISSQILSAKDHKTERNSTSKKIESLLNIPLKSPELVEDRYQDLAEVFAKEKVSEYLISFDKNEIRRDYEEYINFYLVEYISEKNADKEPYLEIREPEKLGLQKDLSKKFNAEYRHYINILSDSDRTTEDFGVVFIQNNETNPREKDFEVLGIWETKQKFKEALKNVKKRILIESPWIKYATQEYLSDFERILQQDKELIILYGMKDKDEHHIITMEKLKKLQEKYPTKFHLIHLPSHHRSTAKGTHRKLMIKDDDYYISGSFNFLSFGKQEGEEVANEESHLFKRGVKEKWIAVKNEYSIVSLLSET